MTIVFVSAKNRYGVRNIEAVEVPDSGKPEKTAMGILEADHRMTRPIVVDISSDEEKLKEWNFIMTGHARWGNPARLKWGGRVTARDRDHARRLCWANQWGPDYVVDSVEISLACFQSPDPVIKEG